MSDISIVKANGRHETFDPEKLRLSLLNAGTSEEVTEEVLAHIVPQIKEGMTTGEIYRHAFEYLKNINK
ncbi:hypothetical protein KW807_02260, partial [Candidatus Parcubacteria bacterium]|nr:hypothetical protein [Candidatus Parcubacteria bacterium]